MRRTTFGLFVSVVALVSVLTLGGCPQTESPALASWVRISDVFGNDIPSATVTSVCRGDSATFFAEGSKDIDFFGWRLEDGPSGRSEDWGDKWSSRFDGQVGDQFVVTVRGYSYGDHGDWPVVVEQSFMVVIAADGNCPNNNNSNNGGNNPPPPQNPFVDLEVNDQDGTVTCQVADANATCSFQVSWTTDNALRVEVSGADNFRGGRPLNSGEAETVTLGIGTWTLVATAIGAGPANFVSDQVVVVVQQSGGNTADNPVLSVHQPHDGATYTRDFANEVWVDWDLEVTGGTPPFTFKIKWPDEHQFREFTTSDRSWSGRKVITIPGTGNFAAQVTDADGRVSNKVIYLINVN